MEQKQKSLQRNIFDFLEVKCETVEDEDAEKKDEIPVQDYLDAVQYGQPADQDFSSNGEYDHDAEDEGLDQDFKATDVEYSTDGM